MFKALLYVCLSLLSLRALCQNQSTELAVVFNTIAEDSNHVISGLTCIGEKQNVVLNWKVSDSIPGFFVIERSDNGKAFETVTVINNVDAKPVYQWTDEAPKKGRSFYRIRYSFHQGGPLYSKTVACFVDGSFSYKFYPNPVDHILIVRSDGPVDVQITDNNGRIRVSEQKIEGLHTINVSSLEKGIYLIRFSNKLTNVMSQEKLMKN